MAINIIEQPTNIAPTGNPMLFRITDSDPDAKFFRVTIRRVGTADVLGTMKVFKTPTTDGNFVDVSRRLNDYTFTEVDNTSNLMVSIDGAVNYYVVFESVDEEGTVLSTSTSTNKWAYRGGGDLLEGINFDITDWYMNIGQIGVKYADFLTSKPLISNIYLFQKEFMYFLADANSGVDEYQIKVYHKNGTIIEHIIEPVVLSPNNILHRLYVQPNLLAEVYDFDVSLVGRIEVALYGDDSTGMERVSTMRTYIIDETYNCSVDKTNILWENYEGGIDTYTFINPKETKSVDRQTMVLNGYAESESNVYDSLSKVVSTYVESTYRITTLGLSDDIYKTLSNMIGTMNSYVELGDGSLWGIIIDNNSIEVKKRKYETSLLRFDLQFRSLPNLDIINRGSVLISEDSLPNPLVFTNITGADFEVQYTSETLTISGINVTVPVTVSGGQYRINNGVWTNQPSIANNGDTITLRVTTAQASLQPYPVTINVGDGTYVWTVTTKQVLNVPTTVSFSSQTGLELNTNATSNTVTITGINVPINISIVNGSYSKNGGAYTSSAGTAVNGDTITVRQTTANASLTSKTTTLTYALKTAGFTTTTREYDITPDDFSFTNLIDRPINTQYTSNIITVGGITDPVSISINNGQYRINGGSWVSTSGTVVNGDTVQLRGTSPANIGQTTTIRLTISNKFADWEISTVPADSTPNPFNFTPNVTGANLSTYSNSNIITVGGINVPSPISVTNTSHTQFRINGGSWRTSSTTVNNGDTVQVRIMSGSSYLQTRSTTVNIGGVTDAWSVTTKPQPSVTLNLCYQWKAGGRFDIRAWLSSSEPLVPFPSTNINISGSLAYTADTGSGCFPGTPANQPFNITINAGTVENTITNIGMNGCDGFGTQINVISTTPANGSQLATTIGNVVFYRDNTYSFQCPF